MSQTLVGFGHSMGGANIVKLSLLDPRLLATIICFELILHRNRADINFAAVYGLAEQ